MRWQPVAVRFGIIFFLAPADRYRPNRDTTTGLPVSLGFLGKPHPHAFGDIDAVFGAIGNLLRRAFYAFPVCLRFSLMCDSQATMRYRAFVLNFSADRRRGVRLRAARARPLPVPAPPEHGDPQ